MYSQSQTHIGVYLRQTLACCCREKLEGKRKKEETSERERRGNNQAVSVPVQLQDICLFQLQQQCK